MNKRTSSAILLLTLAGVLILGSIFIYLVTVYQPSQLHAQAMATVVAGTSTSVAQARSTAQATAARAQATSLAVATQIALGDLYNQVTSGQPVINDQLQAQNGNKWGDDHPTGNTTCEFVGGIYDVKAAAGYRETCLARATNFSNLAFQVEMDIVSGHSGGLVIRSDANDSGYYFRISTDGTFLGRSVQVDTQRTYHNTPLFAGQSPAVKTGNDQFNQITVIAQGRELYMYVNQQFVFKVTDDTYQSGQIGVFTDSDASGTEIQFRSAQVWQL